MQVVKVGGWKFGLIGGMKSFLLNELQTQPIESDQERDVLSNLIRLEEKTQLRKA